MKDLNIAVIGLGYVGLPVAFELSEKFKVIGFDINSKRVKELQEGVDITNEVEDLKLEGRNISYTNIIEEIKDCNIYIVAVPTPVNEANQPDLSILVAASNTVGQVLSKGDIVIYESTVYPGATEVECIPELERASGLKNITDFEVGYSPERINPGDKVHTFRTIKKVISAQSNESLDVLEHIYGSVIEAGVFRASSLKVAEASKVIENTQRDLNIALMNELAIIFDRMDIDTNEVIEAAATKWNFLKFLPGLVGGHCIGVDPYYLTHKAETIGYHPQVILAGRRLNDDMGTYIALRTIKRLVKNGFTGKNSRILVLGATFKENCPDLRNSQVIKITEELGKYGFNYDIYDPMAETQELKQVHQDHVVEEISHSYEGIVLAVSHSKFTEINIKNTLTENGVLIDVKSFYNKEDLVKEGIDHWRL